MLRKPGPAISTPSRWSGGEASMASLMRPATSRGGSPTAFASFRATFVAQSPCSRCRGASSEIAPSGSGRPAEASAQRSASIRSSRITARVWQAGRRGQGTKPVAVPRKEHLHNSVASAHFRLAGEPCNLPCRANDLFERGGPSRGTSGAPLCVKEDGSVATVRARTGPRGTPPRLSTADERHG